MIARQPLTRLDPADPEQAGLREANLELMMTSFNAPRAGCELNISRLDDAWVVADPEGALEASAPAGAAGRTRVLGGYGVFRGGMMLLGREVPLGAIAGVGVAPEARGTGVGSGMMASALDELRAAGVPLAALYASTFGLYRKVGFEQAGSRFERRSRAGDLRITDRELPVRAIGEAELREVRASIGLQHGQLTRGEGLWARLLRPSIGRTQTYAVGERGRVEGWAVLWQAEPGAHFEWKVRDWASATPRAARRLWALLGDSSTMAEAVSWPGPANDPMVTLLPEPHVTLVGEDRTMLRIVDLPAAIAARGWARDGALTIDVTDDTMPENDGRWQLDVRGGVGTAARVGPRPDAGAPEGLLARLHIRALAALYTGFHTAAELAGIGRVEADGPAIRALDALFAAPRPWMADKF